MEKLQLLIILLTLTCFFDGIVSVTDEEFKNLQIHVTQELKQLKEVNSDLLHHFEEFKLENTILKKENERQHSFISQLMNQAKNEKTIAFAASMEAFNGFEIGKPIYFWTPITNEGSGYDRETGTFTVPVGGKGYYYFSVYLTLENFKFGYFDIEINGRTKCTAFADQTNSIDFGHTSCSVVVFAKEGDKVWAMYQAGTDTSPLRVSGSYLLNGFNGFRLSADSIYLN